MLMPDSCKDGKISLTGDVNEQHIGNAVEKKI